jgi:hypothetical protein
MAMNETVEIKSIRVLSAAKTGAVLGTAPGLVVGAVNGWNQVGSLGVILSLILGLVSLLIISLFGFIYGLVGAFLYNEGARRIGGLEMTVQQRGKSDLKPESVKAVPATEQK